MYPVDQFGWHKVIILNLFPVWIGWFLLVDPGLRWIPADLHQPVTSAGHRPHLV